MADLDPDILAITVHGTQCVSIKEEREERYPVEDEIQDALKRECLTLKPLVYTTRLDDMNAFNQINIADTTEVTNKILDESKPRYKHMIPDIKREPIPNSFIASYILLCTRVQLFNTKVETKAKARVKDLLKQCKPLRIVLQDINKGNKLIFPVNIEPEEDHLASIDYLSRRVEQSSDEEQSSEEEVPLSVISSLRDETMSASGNTASSVYPDKNPDENVADKIVIALQHKTTNMVDVYKIYLSKGIEVHLKVKSDEYTTIQKIQKCNKNISLLYCCWVEREKLVQLLVKRMAFTVYKPSIANFLRIPHSCQLGKCVCCCKRSCGWHKKKYNQNIVSNSKQHVSVTNSKESIDDIIKKAFIYTVSEVPDVVSKPISRLPDQSSLSRGTVVIIKYQKIMLKQTQKLGENYEISVSGEMHRYVIPTVNLSVTEEIAQYRKNDKKVGVTRIFFFKLICCWHKRQSFLTQQLNKLKPRALNFIRSPHLCGSVCECCCKPVLKHLENIAHRDILHANDKIPLKFTVPANTDWLIKKRLHANVLYPQNVATNQLGGKVLDQVMVSNKLGGDVHSLDMASKKQGGNVLPQNVAPTKQVGDNVISQNSATKKRSTQQNVPVQKPNDKILFQDLITENVCENEAFNDGKPIPRHFIQKPDVLLSKTIQDDIDLTVDANFIQKPLPIIINLDEEDSSSSSKADSIPNQAPQGLESTILNGVLGRFKDLKLGVNEKGKLTALINTAPGNLTTVEIKVLSDILSLAAVQISQLGIRPKEFCKRVNASRANGQTGLVVPQLVPIETNTSVNTIDTQKPNPKNNVNEIPTKKQQHKPKIQQTQRDNKQQGYKTMPTSQPESINIPVQNTFDTDTVTNIYSSMSQLGAEKNYRLVSVYVNYFSKDVDLKLSKQQMDHFQQVRLIEKPPAKKRVRKRQNPPETKPNPAAKKKIRVKSPTQLIPDQQPIYFPQIARSLGNIPLKAVNTPVPTPLSPVIVVSDAATKSMQVVNNNIIPTAEKQFVNNNFVPSAANHQFVNNSFVPSAATHQFVNYNFVPTTETQHFNNNFVPSTATQPFVNNNFLPVIVDTVSVVANSGPGLDQNPLLYQMLSHPPARPPIPASLLPVDPRKTPVTPFIIAYSKANPNQPEAKRRKFSQTNDEVTIASNSEPKSNDLDNENSIDTAVIQVIKPNLETPRERVIQMPITINNEIASVTVVNRDPMQLDDGDDEDDCIFGV